MSITVKLMFPAGRYHATPWGRHVNEGVAEWPPPPWRLLRALVAVWKRTCPELSEQSVRRVLEPLSQPPRFQLPPYRTAHTRHYMPWEKKGPLDRTLVFDTFVSVARQTPVFIDWPEASLAAVDRENLSRLLQNMSSLGRAESWVQAELIDDEMKGSWLVPSENDANPVPVFCPDPATAFADDYYPTLDAKKRAKGTINPSEFLFDCPRWHLCLDTEAIHAQRWPTVPGSRWLNYARPSEHSVRISRRKLVVRPKPTVARFMLDGPVLPLTNDTVRVAEAFRRAVMSRFAQWCRRHPDEAQAFQRNGASNEFSSPTLSGRELDSGIRKDHRHAYYLPTAEGADLRRITHVTVTAEDGFGPSEVAAFTSLRTLESMKLRVQLVGIGQPVDFDLPLFRASTVWESVTPFVVHRRIKHRGTKRDCIPSTADDPRSFFVQLTARELIERQYGLSPVTIENFERLSGPRAIDFRRYREYRQEEARGRWFGYLRLRFPEPISGPLAIGYGSHFGLGVFSALA